MRCLGFNPVYALLVITASMSSVNWNFISVSALPTPSSPIQYRRFRGYNNISLDVAVAGTGPQAIVFTHGYPEVSWFWRGLIDPLLAAGGGNQYTLYMPDQRGFNQSDKPTGIGSYNMSLLRADIATLINEGIPKDQQPVHLVGHDWGGPVAWCVASAYPSLVRTLTIINGPHPDVFRNLLRTDSTQRKRSSYMLTFDSAAADLMDTSTFFSDEPWWDAATAAAYKKAYAPLATRHATLNWYRANVFNGKENQKAFPLDVAGTMPYNVTISAPTLVIWGMADTAFDNEKNLQGLAAYVPELTVKRYDGVNHWVAQAQPARTAADMVDFFAA